MTPGKKIAYMRKQKNMSQEDLASYMQISRQAVSKWENGISNPDTENLIRLAELFEVDVNTLIGCPVSETTPGQAKKNTISSIHLLSILLAFSLSLTALFAVLWIVERHNHRNVETKPVESQTVSHWESVRLYSYTGPQKKEISLTDEEKSELSHRIWNYDFTEKTDVDAGKQVLYGKQQIYLEFIRNRVRYVWYFTSTEITCTVIMDNGNTLCRQYEADHNLFLWLQTYTV